MVLFRLMAAVLLPRDRDEAVAVVKMLHAAGVPWVPRGAGTGLSGGATAPNGEVVLSVARLRCIHEIDAKAGRARVAAGVINSALNQELIPFGLMYAPDPSSQATCTLGWE